MTPLPPLTPNAWLRWDLVSRLLPENAYAVLEIGCGQGGFGVRLSRMYRYVGLEPDPESFRIASERMAACGGHGEVHNGDLSALKPAETFDLVCAFEVIEHLEDDDKALAEWAARLRPGGWLLLSTPAFQHRFGPGDAMVGHYRRYDPAILRRLLQQTGLVDIELYQYGGPLGYVLEAARNQIGRRRMAALARTGATMEERTSGSGRLLQPRSRLRGLATQWGTWPFRWLQRRFPNHGPGLVARARLPR